MVQMCAEKLMLNCTFGLPECDQCTNRQLYQSTTFLINFGMIARRVDMFFSQRYLMRHVVLSDLAK